MGRRWGLEFDEEHLRRLIRTMTPRSQVFKVLREELSKIGRWNGGREESSGKHETQS